MATGGAKNLKLSARIRFARMINLMNLYGNAILSPRQRVFGNIESETAKHTDRITAIGNLVPVYPDIGTVINPLKIQPDLFVAVLFRQNDHCSEPIRIFPGILLPLEVTVPGKIMFGIEGVGDIGDAKIVHG